MTPAPRRTAVTHAMTAAVLSERQACRFTGFARASQRYRSRRPPPTALRDRLATLAELRPRWGYTNYRVRHLGLDGLLGFLYSPPDHAMPNGAPLEEIRRYPAEDYQLKLTQHRHTPEGQIKPNKAILLQIMRDVGAEKENTIYVGDSEMKDIAMAQDAGVIDVLAKYGEVQHKEYYQLLREVSHWPDTHVKQEMVVKDEKKIRATYTIDSFSEFLGLFDFTSFSHSGKQSVANG